jgi:phosphatidylcholine synthase
MRTKLTINETLQHRRVTTTKLAGVALHAYTASGVLFAFLTVVSAVQGSPKKALSFAFIAYCIDGTDGIIARRLRVSETIPTFDGALLDNIVDYLTYAFVPMILLWVTHRLPGGLLGEFVSVLPLLASAYQFCRADAKTSDHFFSGFPSYWNVIAFYVYVLDLSDRTTAIVLLVCCFLSFVPVRYMYPSRTPHFRRLNIFFMVSWMVIYAILLEQMPDASPFIIALSFVYPVYYMAISIYLTFARRVDGALQSSGS